MAAPALGLACATLPSPLALSAGGGDGGSAEVALQVYTLAVVLSGVRLVDALRGVDATAAYVDVLLASFYDMLPLLAVVLVLVLSSGLAFFLQFAAAAALGADGFADDDLFADVADAGTALAAAYKMGFLGDFSTGAFGSAASPAGAWLLFTAVTVAVTLVSLNAVIALLGDTYDRVQEGRVASRNRQRAALTCEYLRLVPRRWRERMLEQSVWAHRLLPESRYREECEAFDAGGRVSAEDAARADGSATWQGRISVISQAVKRSGGELEKKVGALVEAKVGALDVKLAAQAGALQATVKAQVGALEAKMGALQATVEAQVGALEVKMEAKVGKVTELLEEILARTLAPPS